MAEYKHVVMFSGGAGSWATAKRVAEQHGTDGLVLLFADVGGSHRSPHAGEDEDTYRFIEEAAANVGGKLVILNQGEDIWEVFKRRRFLGNSRQANCSHELKQKPCRKWLEENCPDPERTAVYVGIDWTETHRLPAVVEAYKPYRAFAPMTEEPYLDKAGMIAWLEAEGIDPPRLYAKGFAHNNCGGGCVRAGQAQFELLMRTNPERFAFWESQEQELREHLEKDVSILTEVRKGEKVQLTLRSFRERLESQPSMFDGDDFGGCGCFVD